MKLNDKLQTLQELIRQKERLAVAFSGGIDSALLLRSAYDVLGKNCIGITAVSPLLPANEIKEAADFCKNLGIPHIALNIDILSQREICANTPDRCYICKKHIFSTMMKTAAEMDFHWLAEGSNADDTSDYRPGMKAVSELGVLSPLLDAGLSKIEIRLAARNMGIPLWAKPSAACLASRIPYGQQVTAEKLRKIASSEEFLRKRILGADSPIRVRIYGEDLARIEVGGNDSDRLFSQRQEVCRVLHSLGFKYITLDLDGFRSGSMNEALGGEKNE